MRTFINRKRRTKRLVEKNGDLRVINIGMEEKSLVFLKDGWTTLVDLRWRWLFLTFFASFLMSWLLFALVWHLIFWLHGDLQNDKLPDSEMQAGLILILGILTFPSMTQTLILDSIDTTILFLPHPILTLAEGFW